MARISYDWQKIFAPVLLPAVTFLAACTSTPAIQPHSHAETITVAPAPVKSRPPSHRALSIAANMIGTPYRYGGTSPRGFDCSGLVYYAYSQVGIQAPRSTREQYRLVQRIKTSELQPGDLVFFKLSGNGISHVGIYAGDNRFIHAPSSGKFVGYASLDNPYWRERLAIAGRLPVTKSVTR